MKKTKRIHNIYREYQKAIKEGFSLTQLVGKYQYIYSSKKGKISCIQLKNYFIDNVDLWEIHSLKGNLFEDVERFETLKEAEKRIKILLD